MNAFEFIDITSADVAFIAYGKDLNELFANSAIAMFEVMVDTYKVEKKVEEKVYVEGHDLESLMFNWLSELLYISDSKNLAFSEFNVNIDEQNFKLEAVCKGEEILPDKHGTKTVVKAATYHQMKIWKEDDVWKAQVILDI